MPSKNSKPDASELPTERLVAELRRRRGEYGRLCTERDKLAMRLGEIEDELRSLDEIASIAGRHASSRARGSKRNTGKTLADALAEVLASRPMRVSDAVTAVREAGYHSGATNFRIMVNQALIRDPRFVRVEHGVYALADNHPS